MITQQEELYRQLEAFGWRKIEGAEPDRELLDWWAHEVWMLESLWKPQECRVYLTFIVDPQKRNVSRVTAALEGPAQWSDVELSLERPGRRKEGLPAFFADLAELRMVWAQSRQGGLLEIEEV